MEDRAISGSWGGVKTADSLYINCFIYVIMFKEVLINMLCLFFFFKLQVNLNCESAVVLGHGNVALDVARILLTPISILEVFYLYCSFQFQLKTLFPFLV